MRTLPHLAASLVTAAVTLAPAGCYDPTYPAGTYRCARNADCPGNLECRCGWCDQKSDAPCDPCTNGSKKRVAGDPGLLKVAFCPAAFQVAGIETDPNCDRRATSTGAGCSVADNCVDGWHVCRTEAELAPLTWEQCGALKGFFASAVPAAPSPVRITCGQSSEAVVPGCGDDGIDKVSCNILGRAMGGTECLSDGWSCGPLGRTRVTLTRRDATRDGGVMCCRDE